METKLITYLLLIIILIITGCSSLSNYYIEKNIIIVSHPNWVEGMQFVDGWTTQIGYAWGSEEVGKMVANDLAKKGWHDIYVLIEFIDPGFAGNNKYAIGRRATWRISIYRKIGFKQN